MSQPEQQHPNPFAMRGGMQGAAVLASILEAGMRFYAIDREVRTRQRDAARIKTEAAEQAATAAREFQRQEGRKAALMLRSAMKTKLATANLTETAMVWRQAAALIHVGGAEPAAVEALRLAQDRMRQLAPDFMDRYEHHAAAGVPDHEAVRRAVYDMHTQFFQHDGPARPRAHGDGRDRSALPSTYALDGAVPESFEVALFREARDLADGLPDGALQQAADSAQDEAAAAARLAEAARGADGLAQALEVRARREQAEGAVEDGTPDNPRTPTVNEADEGDTKATSDVAAGRRDKGIAAAVGNTPGPNGQPDAQSVAFPHPPRSTSTSANRTATTGPARTNTSRPARGR